MLATPRQHGQGSLISALNAPPSIRRESISRTAVASASTAAPPNSARPIIPPATPIVAPTTPLMAQPARAPAPFIVPPAKPSTSPTPSADASLYETASRGFAYPAPSSQPPPPHPQLAPPALPATPSASASSRPPLPPPHAPRPRALRRLLRLGRQHDLTGALGQWRLALAHLLRHQSLLRLQQQAQQQAAQMATLRRSLPSAATAVPRPGHPTAGAPSAPAQGSPLLRDALLLRLIRHFRLLGMSGAFGRWLLLLATGGFDPQLIHALRPAVPAPKATDPKALKRASVQEAEIARLRERLAAAEADAESKGRALTLAQRQLATATDRRRVAEAGGKHAIGELSKLQLDAGRARAMEAELDALHEAEATLLDDTRRLAIEAGVLAAELHAEERSGAHARELVVSCHAALLRAQDDQRRCLEHNQATQRKGIARCAAQQSAMAADLRELAALFGRAAAQKKALAAARRRTHEESERRLRLEPVREPTSAVVSTCSSVATSITAPRRVGGGSATSSRASSARGGFGERLPLSGVDEGESALEEAVAEAAAAEAAAEAEEEEEERAAAIAATASAIAAANEAGEAAAAEAVEAAATAAAVEAAAQAIAGTAADLASAVISPTEAAASARATSLAASLAASVLQARSAAIQRVLRSALTRRLGRAWLRWLLSSLAFGASAATVALTTALEERAHEVERLRLLLHTCRAKLTAEKQIASRKQTEKQERSTTNVAVKQLGLQVQVLQRRLQQEQQARKAEQRRQEASVVAATHNASRAGAAACSASPARIALATALAAQQGMQGMHGRQQGELGMQGSVRRAVFSSEEGWPEEELLIGWAPGTGTAAAGAAALTAALRGGGFDAQGAHRPSPFDEPFESSAEYLESSVQGAATSEPWALEEEEAEEEAEDEVLRAMRRAAAPPLTAPRRQPSSGFDWEEEYDRPELMVQPGSAVAIVEAALSPPRAPPMDELRRWSERAALPPQPPGSRAPGAATAPPSAVDERIAAARARAARVLMGGT